MSNDDYTVVDGLVKDPGKFEGQPHWVPKAYQASMDGDGEPLVSDSDWGDGAEFLLISDETLDEWDVSEDERKDVYAVFLEWSSDGFVTGSFVTILEYQNILNSWEC